MVSLMHEQNIICSQTQSGDIAHEQTIICGQLFAGHMVGTRPMKRKKMISTMGYSRKNPHPHDGRHAGKSHGRGG